MIIIGQMLRKKSGLMNLPIYVRWFLGVKKSDGSKRLSEKYLCMGRGINLEEDFLDFIVLCNKHEVKYLVIGGYAVSIHGYLKKRNKSK